MTVKRLLAFLGAVALIVGAVFLRNALDDKSSSSSGSTDQPSGGKATVICSTEFADVCAKLDASTFTVTVEPATTTLAHLSADGARLPDAWVTLDPFPGMIDELRTQATLDVLAPAIVAVATDVPEIAVAKSRSGSFDIGCQGQSVWKCIGANAGRQWTDLDPSAGAGKVLLGTADPDVEALGLVTFANAIAGYLGTTSFDSSAWQGNPALTSWLRNLKSNDPEIADGGSALSTLLLRPTQVNVAATTGAEIQANPQPDSVVAKAVSPAIAIVAVVATFAPTGNDVAGKLAPLLTKAGWTAATDPKPSLPPGTFIALRKLWEGK